MRPGDDITNEALASWVRDSLTTDDVLSRPFLRGIIFNGAHEAELQTRLDRDALRRQWGIERISFLAATNETLKLQPGPYRISHNGLEEVWRVYSDDNLAFVQSAWLPRGSKTWVHYW